MKFFPYFLFLFAILFLTSCEKKAGKVNFGFNDSGELIPTRIEYSSIVPLGVVTNTMMDKLKEPGFKVTRIGIRTLDQPVSYFDVYDINFDGEVKIIGDGKYDFSKLPGSNTWYITLEKKGINDIIIKQGQKEIDQINMWRGIGLCILGLVMAIVGFAASATCIGFFVGVAGIIVIILGWGIIP